VTERRDPSGNRILEESVDAAGNTVRVAEDERGNRITETRNPETGEVTRDRLDEAGMEVVREERDTEGNLVTYKRDAATGCKYIVVLDVTGATTTTEFRPDGGETTTRTDASGREITDEYRDDAGNYVVGTVDEEGSTVVRTVDRSGSATVETTAADGTVTTVQLDASGREVIERPTPSAPAIAFGLETNQRQYHVTWESSADDGGSEILYYTVYWDDYSEGRMFVGVEKFRPQADRSFTAPAYNDLAPM